MSLFSYTGTNRKGEEVSGTLDAVDASAARKALVDLGISPMEITATDASSPAPVLALPAPGYHPLIDTLRLYAGWLLAILFLIYAAGSYQLLKKLPVHSELLHEWITSSLILHVTAVTFLFLMLSSLHRAMGRGLWKGLILMLLGFGLLVLFRLNT